MRALAFVCEKGPAGDIFSRYRRIMKKRLFVLISLSLAAPWLFMGSAFSADYVWKGSVTNPNWSRSQNWTPSTGFPQAAGDKAIFDSNATSLCNVADSVKPTTVTLDAGFAWVLNATSVRGSILCDDFSLTSGTVTATGADKIRATRKLNILGGNITHATCEGVATLASGVVGTLRMTGNPTVLQGDDFVPFVFKTLTVGPGTTLQHHIFAPLEFALDAQTTYTLAPLSSLTVEKHDINGLLQLAPGSLLSFAKGADIQGAIDHSHPVALIVCNGDWKCPGSYWPSYTSANILTINQSLASGIVDHGGNNADMVIIRGKKSAGMNTEWKSSNTIRGLRVSSDTLLSLADGVHLYVQGEIYNSSSIQLGAGAVLEHHARMDFQTASGDLNADYFYAGSPIFVRLLDGDQNLEGTEIEKTGGVVLQNSRNGDKIEIELTEISASAGIFASGPIATEKREEAVDDGILQVVGGDTVLVTYADPDDPQRYSSQRLDRRLGSPRADPNGNDPSDLVSNSNKVANNSAHANARADYNHHDYGDAAHDGNLDVHPHARADYNHHDYGDAAHDGNLDVHPHARAGAHGHLGANLIAHSRDHPDLDRFAHYYFHSARDSHPNGNSDHDKHRDGHGDGHAAALGNPANHAFALSQSGFGW